MRRKCKCGRNLTREATPTCAEWCAAAPECLGLAIDKREWEKKIAKLKDDPKAKEYVNKVRSLCEEKKHRDCKAE